ncbi:hypothetical protein L1787_02945 [Acuticoccus sp. M5D2P5]|uniref:amidase family protein n=1 Tax=Acuticoccus kalidii TaxID=2910977 RepID=UPI001EEDDD14|nr:amidase family protein [Acuticoccus kalidii]MCF3932371.1 hypothetical protein [Acuticoccus kalidii]
MIAPLDPFNAFVDRVDAPGEGPRVAVKDMIAVRGRLQTAGLAVYEGRRAEADAAIVAAFRRHSYAIVGTTRSDAAGYGTMTDEVANPRDADRAVGGSSGGSAAAVAAGLADIGVGTDTGGSGRIPAAYCDLFAFKPSLGRSDMVGIIPLAETFDTPALMTADPARLVSAAPMIVTDWRDAEEAPARLTYDSIDRIADPAIVAAFASALRHLPASAPKAVPTAYEPMAVAHSALVCREGLAVHASAWETAPERFPAVVAQAFRYAESLTDDEIGYAREAVAAARAAWRAAIGPNEIRIRPTLPIAPAPRHTEAVTLRGVRQPITNANIRLTLAASVAGLPVVVAPVNGLSLQFIGAYRRDEWLLARVLELLAEA